MSGKVRPTYYGTSCRPKPASDSVVGFDLLGAQGSLRLAPRLDIAV